MDRVNSIFGTSKGFDKACIISKLPDGIKESPNHKDLFMVYSNSSNYRIVDMSVCKCSCPNERICSHIISILIRYSTTQRNYLNRLLILKELEKIKEYSSSKQLNNIIFNLHAIFDTFSSKQEVIETSASLIIGLYHRFITKFSNLNNSNTPSNPTNHTIPVTKSNVSHKTTQTHLINKSHKLGYIASLNPRQDISVFNSEIITNIRSYNNHNNDLQLDQLEFNKACAIYSKLSSSKYISTNPKSISSICMIDSKHLINIIKMIPPLTELNSATNWKLNFYPSFGPLLEFVTTHMDGHYLVTSHNTIYPLKISQHNIYSTDLLIDENIPIEELASIVLYLFFKDNIEPYIKHLHHLFMNCTIQLLLKFISLIPIELINNIYSDFLGNILLNRNLTLKTIGPDKNLLINLYIGYKLGYIASLPNELTNYDTINNTSINNIIMNHENDSIINVVGNTKTNKIEIIQHDVTPNVSLDLSKENHCTIDPKDAKLHIEYIRRDKYGIDNEQFNDEYIGNHNEKLSRILDKLSSNLYSSTNQILFELIQNADDNSYFDDTIPELIIVQTNDSLTLFNNEKGFSKADVESICDLANSTKIDRLKSTGNFGIGFKSVFSITNEPYILSNGYQFKFTSHGIGKLVPQWVDDSYFLTQIIESANIDSKSYNTIIHLPLIKSIQFDISYNLILHLKRIRKLSFIQINDDGNNKVILSTTELITDTSFIIKKIFYNDIELNFIQYIGANSNIQLTFPFEYNNQFVYSTLPIGNFGLNFAINSPFNLTLDRSNLIYDEYNLSIINQIPKIFLNALEMAKQLDRKIYYTILSTFPKNATGIFSILNSRFNELLTHSNIIPTTSGVYARPSDSLYLPQINENNSQMESLEFYVKSLIDGGYINSYISADDIPRNLAMTLNLPMCDFWHIIRLFENFTREIDSNEMKYAIYVLKIVNILITRNNNMKNHIIEVVQKYIKFPYFKGLDMGSDTCNKIYIGDQSLYKNILQLLPFEITCQFTLEFLLEVGFNDAKDILNNFNWRDIDLPQELKFSISVNLIKSLEITKDYTFNKYAYIPIYGTYSNYNNEITNLHLNSPEIVLLDHEFYDLLIQQGHKLFIPSREYPNLSQLLLNNTNRHLNYLLEIVQMDTALALEYFKFIKYLLETIDKLELDLDIGEFPVPIGKWALFDGQLIWKYEDMVKISCTNSIKYLTKTPPEILNSQPMDSKILLSLLKFLQNADILYKAPYITQCDNYILLENITDMWANRSIDTISNALIEALETIYQQLSSSIDEDVLNELSESHLIFTTFQDTLTHFGVDDVYINGFGDLNLPIKPLSQIYKVNKSFWKGLNIEDTPSPVRLIELLKSNSSLAINSVISTVIYLYQHMDTNEFILGVSALNIIPGWNNNIKNKEIIKGKITLLKPEHVTTITQCADLSLFSLDKYQILWNKIIETLTKLTYNQIDSQNTYEYYIEDMNLNSHNYIDNYDKYRIEVGLSGERIVYNYLLEKYGNSVKWLNERGEQGLPYDITFLKDGIEKFVEVKSSNSHSKKAFEISHPEWLFAQIKGEDFIIYRVNSVNSEQPLITILPNPYYLWKNKKIAFCLSL